jgi:hypothetical protein
MRRFCTVKSRHAIFNPESTDNFFKAAKAVTQHRYRKLTEVKYDPLCIDGCL